MKHIKYIVIEKNDFENSCIPLSSAKNTLEEAIVEKEQCQMVDAEFKASWENLDSGIDTKPIEYHIYKLEQAD